MTEKLRMALAQINPTVGDLEGNAGLIVSNVRKAAGAGADLVIFPELAVSGYPPEDLLTRPGFLRKSARTLEKIARETAGAAVILGAPAVVDGKVKNAALVLSGGRAQGMVFKTELPNYGVFDERRYFAPGANGPLVKVGPAAVGVTICEDIWTQNDITDKLTADGANLLVNLSGSPYRVGILEKRRKIVGGIARKLSVPFAYCNLAGGQDELVFDGRSFVSGPDGEVIAGAEPFGEDLLIVDVPVSPLSGGFGRDIIDLSSGPAEKPSIPQKSRRVITGENAEIYEALVLGARDYVGKNGFRDVVIALSGGIDSALAMTVAVDALGPERVHAVSLPSPYSSEGSITDARRLAENLDAAPMISLPIEGPMKAFEKTLEDVFRDTEPGVAEENIQARIRGALVMALSNKFGWLALTTGNKSEIAVGYCTLYGDMVGGFSVIKDVFKTRVYALCEWRNLEAGRELIPRSIIEKPPSAELRPGQLDIDSLPPYNQLDPILEAYIEGEKNIDEIVDLGYSRPLVSRVIRMVDKAEYKRRQGPIGVKITAKAFGRDRRHPITCRYVDE
ncbi:MAG: NAD+ synthase [Candidatus Nitrospinota bacterium M3_3B_026]